MRKNLIKNVQRAATFAAFLLIFTAFGTLTTVNAQINIASGGTITQNFDGIGTTAAATLPAGFRVTNTGAVRTVATYSAAGTATTQMGGNALSATAGNGIYNFGAGPAGTATDRAIGFLSSASATQNGNLYVQLVNNGATTISQLTVSYNVEKYRNGSNAAGFRTQLFTSTNDVTYTAATPAAFTTTFAADANNNGFTTAPGTVVPVTGILTVSIAPGASLYLAFNYSVASGTTTSNAQALAFDDIVITAGTPTAATVEVGGRVVDVRGRGITKARVTVTDNAGVSRSVVTNAFGDFGFDGVEVGETYVYSVSAKGYQFSQPSQALTVNDNYSGITFNAISSGFPTTRK